MNNIRIMKDDQLVAEATVDNYAMVGAAIPGPPDENGEIAPLTGLSIHPDDLPLLQTSIFSQQMDRSLIKQGVSPRTVRVWTSNLAMLNLKFMVALVEHLKPGWGGTIPPGLEDIAALSSSITTTMESSDQITSVMGLSHVADKVDVLGTAAYIAFMEATDNPDPVMLP